MIFSAFSFQTRINFSGVLNVAERAAESGVSLIAAASSVGLILGVVTLTGIGAKLPGILLPLAQQNLILALFILMVSTIILGMGLPTTANYLVVAALLAQVVVEVGAASGYVFPLIAVHLYVFYL